MLVILVNKKRALWLIFAVAVVISLLVLYKPYLRKYEYPLKFSEYVTASAEGYGVDEYLIYSVIKSESGFKPDVQSAKGAQGLMQITPQTAQWALGKMEADTNADIFLPEVNISVGSWYLGWLIDEYDGNLAAALAAYNAGPTNVGKWIGEDGLMQFEDIEFAETRDYVEKTLKYYEMYKKLYQKGE